MRILYIVPYVPSPVRVRPYNLVRSLARRGHQITLATLVSGLAEAADLETLRSSCGQVISERAALSRSAWNSAQAFFSAMPLQANWSWHPGLASTIARELQHGRAGEGFDVIHVEHLRGAQYGAFLRRRTRIPIVWDSVDSISLLFRQAVAASSSSLTRQVARFELNRTQAYERWAASQFNAVLVTSPLDKNAFLSLPGLSAPGDRFEVLPNGVDLDAFSPGNGPREPATLVVSGKMSYHANVSMALFLLREIAPKIWARNPGMRVVIVGKDPPREILAFAEDPRVRVTGTVKDVAPFLQKSTVAVAPIQYGVGIQNKVLEAMATGTPVVTTPQGNSALTARPDQDLLVAADAEEFASKTCYLLDRPAERTRIGEAGRAYVMAHHCWDRLAARLEGIYQKVIAQQAQST